jgi:predicted nucleic acid-binding protein
VPIKRIVNASPLILLTKIGRIDLLFADDVDVVVPMPVLQEVSPDPGDPADPIVRAIFDARGSVAMPSSPVPETLSRWKLDPGEESVLTVALQSPGCEVVIDDLAGRRCAKEHGVKLLGTLGLVILAKRLDWITETRPIIEDIRRVGLYVKENVIADALKQAGE